MISLNPFRSVNFLYQQFLIANSMPESVDTIARETFDEYKTLVKERDEKKHLYNDAPFHFSIGGLLTGWSANAHSLGLSILFGAMTTYMLYNDWKAFEDCKKINARISELEKSVQ